MKKRRMKTMMRSAFGFAIALVVLWIATVAGSMPERLPGAFDQGVPGMAVETGLPKTELFAVAIAALLLLAFSVAAWRGGGRLVIPSLAGLC